ncbi:MAG: SLAC1 anion channel family protein [Deferribacterales bacterium]
MEETEANRLKNFPITLFSTVMGLSGLAIAYMRYGSVMKTDTGFSKYFLYAVTVWFAVLVLIYALKLIKYPSEVRHEFLHPVRMNFFPTISISMLLLSIGYENICHPFASALWWAGSLVHITFTFVIINMWFFREYKIHAMNPAWFIPVVGNILVPVVGANFGGTEMSWFFFSIGLVLWVVLYTIVIYRVIFHDALVQKFLPTLFIMIAPPAVGFISYSKLTGGLDSFGRILFYFAVFTTLILVSMFPRLRKTPFYMSWWAYTFPMDAMTIATILMYKMTGAVFFKSMAFVLLAVTTCVVVLVLVRTVYAVTKRDVCIPE